jgi:hypothetical protein
MHIKSIALKFIDFHKNLIGTLEGFKPGSSDPEGDAMYYLHTFIAILLEFE